MLLTLKADVLLIDTSKYPHADVVVEAGEHDFTEVANPFGRREPWFVVEGTKAGACRDFVMSFVASPKEK